MIKQSNGYFEQYLESVRSGDVLVCEDMEQELENLFEDLDSDEFVYDTRDADLRISFIEGCVRLTKSPFYGQPMQLLPWQKAFVSCNYGFKIKSLDTNVWVDRFQESLLLIPRKNGKTEFIAALQLSELILGKSGSDIVCSGTDDGTAALAYDAIDTMRLLIDPQSVDTWRNQKGIKCLINNNHVYRLSASTRQREGRNIDVAGIDEVWSLDATDDIYKVIQQSTSTKDDFKIFMFGSEGFVDDGLLDNKREEYRKIIYKEDVSPSSKRKLPWIYSMDYESEVWETNSDGVNPAWVKANPSLGVVKKWSYLRDRVDEAKRSKAERALTLTKDFNLKVADSSAWLESDWIATSDTFDLEDFRGAVAVAGVDLAETTDMCSAKILLMRKDDKTKYLHSMYWIPESKLAKSDDVEAGAKYREWAKQGLIRIVEDNNVPVSLVADWFAELYREYGIRLLMCGYDQRFASEFIKRMDSYGFEHEMVYQSRYVLSLPMRMVEEDLRQGLINFNDNPIDRWCFGNTSVKVWDTGFIMPIKFKGQEARRIDGTVSTLIAFEILRRYRQELMGALR